MATITTGSPPTKILAQCHSTEGLCFPKTTAISMRSSEISFLQQSPKKMNQLNFCYATRLPRKTILHSLPLTKSQAGLSVDIVEGGIETSDPIRLTRVRFQLQKKCGYGEHFLLVGDDPILGSWDPSHAIPLHWSDDHIWTADLDMPIGKAIQYKFILKNHKGDIHWQPGPDRSFRSWGTPNSNMLVINEDWDKASKQKISEEEIFMSAHERGRMSSDELEDGETWIDPILSSDEALAKDLKKSMATDNAATD